MKRKYYITFSVILIVIFSLTAISAVEDEDICSFAENSSDGDVLQIPDQVETVNQISPSPEKVTASDDECDLSVDVSVNKTYVGDKFNRAGSVINWTVTVKVTDGVARNTKVHVNFSNNMEYYSCNKTIGEYDSSTNIWDIGDLSSSQIATLIIFTKLKSDGHFNLAANATTDSIDVNLLNNFASKDTKSGSGNNGSNITQNSTAGERFHPNPRPENPIEDPPISIEEPYDPDENGRENNGNSNGGGSNGNSNGWRSNGNGGFASARYRSNTDSVAMKTLNPFDSADSTSSILKKEDSKLLGPISKFISVVVPPYDYTRIPILVFALFLLVLAGIVGYDKLKSRNNLD